MQAWHAFILLQKQSYKTRTSRRRPLRGFETLEVREVLSASSILPEYDPLAARQNHLTDTVPGELLIQFRDAASLDDVRGVYRTHGLQELERLYNSDDVAGIRRVSVPGVAIEAVTRALQNNPQVQFAEPNFLASAFTTVNDTFFAYQWNFSNPTNGGINVEQAWEVSTGANAIVAVLDTGVAYKNHQDATGIYYQAPDFASTRFVAGYDFINNNAHANDDHSHGTHVAGTIAQSTNNARGTAGIAFDASIMPVKVLGKDGSGSHASIANGIRWATDQGAHIINMSLGSSTGSKTLKDAVAYAYSRGVTIVAAAGNEGNNAVSYPAAYDDYVIAVSATRFDETLASYSNYGSSIDLAAPGGDIGVDQNGDGFGDGILQNTFNPRTQDTSDFGYYFFQGTSMAAPHVAGVAALIVSQGITDPAEVRHILQSTAKDRGPVGVDIYYGHGIVDAAAAMDAIRNLNAEPEVTNTAPVANQDVAETSSGTPVTIDVLANDFDADGDPLSVQSLTAPSHGTAVINADQTITYSPNLNFSGSDSFTYTISDSRGGTDTAVVSVSVVAVPTTETEPDTEMEPDPETDSGSDDGSNAVRVVDLDGSVTTVRNQWRAAVSIFVADSKGSGVAGLTVTGRWSDGRSFTATTDAAGQATATSVLLPKRVASISLQVESVDHPAYDPTLNSDPDGDSDGTSIIVYKDGSTAAGGFQLANDQDPASPRRPLEALGAVAEIAAADANGSGRKSIALDYELIVSQFGNDAQVIVRFGDEVRLLAGQGWQLGPPRLQDGEAFHTLRQNDVEVRVVNGRPWNNPLNPADVNHDGKVDALDALQILNFIQAGKGGDLSARDDLGDLTMRYYDTTGNGSVGAIDALQVINSLARGRATDSLQPVNEVFTSMAPLTSSSAENTHDEAMITFLAEHRGNASEFDFHDQPNSRSQSAARGVIPPDLNPADTANDQLESRGLPELRLELLSTGRSF